jgi:sec-independent protein translocase protein TatB
MMETPIKSVRFLRPEREVSYFPTPGICVTLLAMFGIGLPELVIILIVALLVVGPSKLPEVARSVGKALGQFRRMADDVKETFALELDREEQNKEESKGEPTISEKPEGEGGESLPPVAAHEDEKKEVSQDEPSDPYKPKMA